MHMFVKLIKISWQGFYSTLHYKSHSSYFDLRKRKKQLIDPRNDDIKGRQKAMSSFLRGVELHTYGLHVCLIMKHILRLYMWNQFIY